MAALILILIRTRTHTYTHTLSHEDQTMKEASTSQATKSLGCKSNKRRVVYILPPHAPDKPRTIRNPKKLSPKFYPYKASTARSPFVSHTKPVIPLDPSLLLPAPTPPPGWLVIIIMINSNNRNFSLYSFQQERAKEYRYRRQGQ